MPARIADRHGPRVYAFSAAVRLRLPLVFYNSGARTLIVDDLRVVVEEEPRPAPLRWVTTRATLRPGSSDGHTFATPFAIQGSAHEVIAEFESDWAPVATSSYLRVQGSETQELAAIEERLNAIVARLDAVAKQHPET